MLRFCLSLCEMFIGAALAAKLDVMLAQCLKKKVRENAGVLRAYVNASVNPPILLTELDQEFKFVVANLEKVRVPALFVTEASCWPTAPRFFCIHECLFCPLHSSTFNGWSFPVSFLV